MKNKFALILPFVSLALLLLASAVSAQIAAGGNYALEQAVVAGGGGESVDSTTTLYKVEGTIGQNAAGTPLTGGNYTLLGGFWQPDPFAPTAADAAISGRVVLGNEKGTKSGKPRGLANAVLILTGGMMTAPRIVRSNQFGYFTFKGVESGHFYILSVQHKRYVFSQNSLSFTLSDDLTDVVFRAEF